MKISVNWLRNYVDIDDISVKDLADKLSLSGLEVESMETMATVSEVVTAKVLTKEKHPNADRLNLCTVTDGTDTYQVVCGAPNVNVGQKVAFAKIGAKLPEITIKEAKIRGIESFGMICSERELGVSEEQHAGILVLPENTDLGIDINGILGLGDTIFELNVTPNRPDWLSAIGVAREISAIFDRKLFLPVHKLKEIEEKTEDLVTMVVKDIEKCPIYTLRIIKNIKLGPSPFWMQARLKASGIRPINNVVDVTNYILLEYGQPLHAFDLRMVETGIIVRNANKDEKLTALDGKEYNLDQDTLIIADHKKPLGIAGIMGGEHTSILPDTNTVLLECAYFTPINIRKTSKRLNISSESSYRYERGIDYGATVGLSDYAAEMIAEICGGNVLKGRIGGVIAMSEPIKITSRAKSINALLGTNIPPEKMSEYLNALYIKTKVQEDKLISDIPTFRGDITREQDITEEIARIYGYDNIETTVAVVKKDAELWSPLVRYTRVVRQRLESLGFNETINFPFMAPDYLNIFYKKDDYVKLLNPISADMAWLRPYVFPAVIKNIQTNKNQGENTIRLFELATAFHSGGADKHAIETQKLCLCSTEDFMDISWIKLPKTDSFYYMKGVLENIIECMGLKSEYSALSDCHFLHPGKSANININCQTVGFIGALHPSIMEELDIKGKIYIAEIDFTKVSEMASTEKIKYKKFSRFPFAERDFAVVVEDKIQIGDILKAVKSVSDIISEAFLFDVFTGSSIGEGKKSLAFRVRLSHPDKTLSEEEMTPILEQILERLGELFDAKLR